MLSPGAGAPIETRLSDGVPRPHGSPPRRSTAWYTTWWCLSSTCRAIERTRRHRRHRLHRRRLVDGHGVRCCRGATDPLLPETCVVRDIGELPVLPAFRRRPQRSASCPGVAERSGGFARGRASTPIRTWSARARAPPPGSPSATTATDRPHGRRVRQTSLPRHSSCRSTERPFRFVVVDHTVRPSPAVPSREGYPGRA